MQIYAYADEIEVIRDFLRDNAAVKGIKSKLALAAGCQLSYLSQAIAKKVHLTPDHGYGISKFLQLNNNETAYFMLLVYLKRASSRGHRIYLEEKIAAFRKSHFNLGAKLSANAKISDGDLQRYYSDWRMQAIHMYLTIPKYQQVPILAEKIGITELDLRVILTDLAAMGLAKKNRDGWTSLQKDMHIPLQSPHSVATQLQWKLRALQDLQSRESSGTHYVGTFSLATDDIETLKAMIIDFIAKTRAFVQASPAEEVAHFGLSFFPL